MTANNVMIDIETLSKNNDAFVLSIGMAAFDDLNVVDTDGIAIDMNYGYGHIDPDTVKWWAGQSEAARHFSFSGTAWPYEAAAKMRNFLDSYGGKNALVWANSPSFDLVILKNWWRNMPTSRNGAALPRPPGDFPVTYKQERDMRTIKYIADQLGIDLTDLWTGVAHNPIEDAAMQARAVIRVMKAIKGRNFGETLR